MQTGQATAAWPAPAVGATPAGVRVVAIERAGPVVALRLTVGVGARHGGVAGSAHMLEHLLFRTRAGAQARRTLEELGGEVGATTTREQVSIDAVVVPADVPAALEALARISSARPSPADLERERDVVSRELAHEEEERRRIWQLQAQALFGEDHPLARPILGTSDTLQRMGPSDIAAVMDRWRAGNAALAAVGPVDLDSVVEAAASILVDRGGEPAEPLDEAPQAGGRRHEERSSRLMHVAVGWRFGGIGDPRLPALRLAEIVLAHGSGSRLYERLRTRRRLAYRVSTVLVPYRDAGHLSAVTACDPHHATQAELAIIGEVERLAMQGPAWPELEAAKRQLHGTLARAFEVSRRLAGFSATQLLFGRLERIDAFLARIDACEPADVADAAGALVRSDGGHAISSVGRAPAA